MGALGSDQVIYLKIIVAVYEFRKRIPAVDL